MAKMVQKAESAMDVSRLSDDDIQDMFTEAYETKVAKQNNFDSFECIVKRSNGNNTLAVEVMVVGMAGSPTVDDYKKGKVKGAGSVTIGREGKGSLTLNLDQKSIVSLNTNDYLVIYKAS